MKKIFLNCLLLMCFAFSTVTGVAGNGPTGCDPCAAVPWSPEIVHQFYFTPMSHPSCVVFAEITYKTKICNGMIMYEITNEELTMVQGSCSFAVCIFGELYNDIEKEMILNVLGTTDVLASKPSACYRLLELDPKVSGFEDCWTHQGAIKPLYPPMMYYPCSDVCCLAKAKVVYDQAGRPIIFWTPLNDDAKCNDKAPVPDQLEYKLCCETTIGAGGEEICTAYKTFTLKVLNSGPCISRCDASMFFKEANVTSIAEDGKVIEDNINFLRGTKIFPNPSSQQFNVKLTLPENQNVTIEILGMDGRLIKQIDLSYETGKTEYSLETADLQAGVYLCKINTAAYGNKIIKINKQ